MQRVGIGLGLSGMLAVFVLEAGGCWSPLRLGSDPGAGGAGGDGSGGAMTTGIATGLSTGMGGAGGAGGGKFVCDPPADDGTIFRYSMQSFDPAIINPVSVCQYRGQVMLMVNTAAKCSYTMQYIGLQGLQASYESRGFSVLGYLSNDFNQAGTTDEIAACKEQYSVTFDQFGIVGVLDGGGQLPLFHWLTTQESLEGPVTWNFNKFLIGRDGSLVARWPEAVEPTDQDVIDAIEAELDK